MNVVILIIVGALVAWAANGQHLGLSCLVTIVYGLFMAFCGFLSAIKTSNEREKVANEARIQLQRQYQRAMLHQLVNMRKALLYLTSRALNKAAGKLVAELLPKFENDEQFDAAVERAKGIVDEEMNELESVLGGVHPEDEELKDG